jgi:secreted trypsin-like serine protease
MEFKSIFYFVFFMIDLSKSSEICGIKTVVLDDRVLGGNKMMRGDWPWLVAFAHQVKNTFFCAGSLISNRQILSGE